MITLLCAALLAVAPSPAPNRWLWVQSTGGTFLSYYYVDSNAGPSAKGAVVSDPPTSAELKAAITAPNLTFRDPATLTPPPRQVTNDEARALGLPARPDWLARFEPVGRPAPAVPEFQAGREHLRAGAAQPWVVEFACGPEAGTTLLVEAGKTKTLVVGAMRLPVESTTSGLLVTAPSAARVIRDGKPFTGSQVIPADAKFEVGKTVLVVRSSNWQPTGVGPEPFCPGVGSAVMIQDGCAMYGSTFIELLGDASMVVGITTPERDGLPPGYKPKQPCDVRLTNTGGKVRFESLTPRWPPQVNGKDLASGTLSVGDQLTVGDRVIGIVGADSKTGALQSTPASSCYEFMLKQRGK
jgi:hypothetical protein